MLGLQTCEIKGEFRENSCQRRLRNWLRLAVDREWRKRIRVVIKAPRLRENDTVPVDHNNPDSPPRTILVVDDFDDTRLLLRTWLQKKGFHVVEAENGLRAVAAARSSCPDLIIMDVEMPELDGLEATRRIRQLKGFETVPIVAVSAYGADQYREHALAAGCDEYVSTPFEPDELEKLIRSLMS